MTISTTILSLKTLEHSRGNFKQNLSSHQWESPHWPLQCLRQTTCDRVNVVVHSLLRWFVEDRLPPRWRNQWGVKRRCIGRNRRLRHFGEKKNLSVSSPNQSENKITREFRTTKRMLIIFGLHTSRSTRFLKTNSQYKWRIPRLTWTCRGAIEYARPGSRTDTGILKSILD